MSNKLYQLGAFAFRRRWTIVAGWLALLVLAGSLMQVFQQPASDSFSIPGTESQLAFDKLEKEFPSANGGSGRIVFAAPQGKKLADYQTVIDSTVAAAGKVTDVKGATSPFESEMISDDGRIGIASVQLTGTVGEVDPELQPAIEKTLTAARSAGLQAELGGDIISQGPSSILGIGEIIGVGIAAITLLITFGTLRAAGMPLATAMVGVGIGVSSVFALGSLISVDSTTPILAVMLGLAVGIDYALFIVTRHRKYLMDGLTPAKAAARAISTAGNAVVFAALTVIIALSALSVVGIPFLTTMGLAAAGTVAIAAAVAITFIPALLSFAGENVLSKKQRALLAKNRQEDTPATIKKKFAYKWVTRLINRPLVAIISCVVVLAAIAVPVGGLQLGFPGEGDAAADTTQRKAYDLVSEGFGAGSSGPLLAVVSLPTLQDKAFDERIESITEKLEAVNGVTSVQPAGTSENKKTALLQITPKTGPTDQATKDLIDSLRSSASDIVGNDAELAITGSTAMTIDVDKKMAEALPKYLLVVVGLSFILLLIVFRSVLIPIKATLGFLLTIAATFGALVMLFQWGWLGVFDPTPIVSFLPIIVVGILFGLAMDYEFFLVSGMQESHLHEAKNKPRLAIVNGFAHGSSVVTAAAIIMIAVFSGFIFSHLQMIQMIGFALAFGVFVDAFIVRMTIVPAVMALFGKSAWWLPTWLAKILPNVSIEGDDVTFNENLKPTPAKKK